MSKDQISHFYMRTLKEVFGYYYLMQDFCPAVEAQNMQPGKSLPSHYCITSHISQ